MTFTHDTPAEAARLLAFGGKAHALYERHHTPSREQQSTMLLQALSEDGWLPALALLQAYRERVAELEGDCLMLGTEIAALLDDAIAAERNLATTRALADGMDEGLREMVLQYGAPHHENCPEDDTCDCPTPRQINKALVLYAAHRKTIEAA